MWFARSVLIEFAADDDDAEDREQSQANWQSAFLDIDWTNDLEYAQNVTACTAVIFAKLDQANKDNQYATYWVGVLAKACARAEEDWQIGGLPPPPPSSPEL